MKKQVLVANAIFLSAYLVAGTAGYLFADTEELYQQHPVFGRIYVLFVLLHAALVAVACLLEWWGALALRRGPVMLVGLVTVLAALELVLLLIPIGVALAFLIVNAVGLARPRPASSH